MSKTLAFFLLSGSSSMLSPRLMSDFASIPQTVQPSLGEAELTKIGYHDDLYWLACARVPTDFSAPRVVQQAHIVLMGITADRTLLWKGQDSFWDGAWLMPLFKHRKECEDC
ncbi:hypothetical protein J3A83DRAFT_4190502 [Scleroderma citrinum]